MEKKVDQRPGLRPGIENYAPNKERGVASAVRDAFENSLNMLSDVAHHLTAKDLTRAGRAFAATVSQFNPKQGGASALTAGLSAALTQLTTQPNYAALAKVYRAQLSELMQPGRDNKNFEIVLEKYAACLAIGIANATLEYHIADTAGERRHWQQMSTEFADTIYRLSPPNEIAVHMMLASYAAVDLDIAALRQRVIENEGRIASPYLRPVPLPGERFEASSGSTPSENEAIRQTRIETVELESLITRTEAHLLGQIDVARVMDDFTRHNHRGIALQLMGDPDRAAMEYEQARTVFRGRRGRNEVLAASELQSEVIILNRLSALATPTLARKYLGEAGGLIDWLGITKPDLAKVMMIENKELRVPLAIQEYETLFAKGELSPEQFNKNVVRDYQDVARHCAALTTSDPQIQAAIHDHILTNKVSALERDLGFVGIDPDETAERHTVAISDFERAQFNYQLTASDGGWHESSGRAAWAMATHFFHHGKVETALGYLREIRERHPESTAAAILRTPHQELWVREFGILTAGGQFSSRLGNPDFVAGLKTVGGRVFDDKAGAMKGVMAGAGVGLGVATADFLAGSHVFGGGALALTAGQLVFGGAAAGLTLERAHRLATSWDDISASYKLGVTHVRSEDLARDAATFGIEIGSMFMGGFAGQVARQGITKLGSRWLTEWMATRGMIYSDITLAREFTLVREAAYVGEGLIFHPVAGASRVAASSAIGLPAYPIGMTPKDFFSSWLNLRTLGLVGAWNPGAIVAASGRFADRATRALINTSVSQGLLTPAQAALSGDFSNLGLHYFNGLFDLLSITAGQHTAKSVGHVKKMVDVLRVAGPEFVDHAKHLIKTVRAKAARYEQVPGPLLLLLPLVRVSKAGTTVLRIDLPGLPELPLKQSDAERSRMIADWAQTHFATADIDSQQTQQAEISASCETWLDKMVMSADAAISKFVSKKIPRARLLDQLKSIRHDWNVYTTIFTSILDHISDEASRDATVQNYEEARGRYQKLNAVLEQIETDVRKKDVATILDHQQRLREDFGIADRSALGELQFARSLYAKAIAIGDPQVIQDARLILEAAELGVEKSTTKEALHALARRIKPLWSQHQSRVSDNKPVSRVEVETELAPEVAPPKAPIDVTPKLAIPGLPVLALPEGDSVEAAAKAEHAQKLAIADWLRINVVDEPLDVQLSVVATLAKAHQEWLHRASLQLQNILTGLETDPMTFEAATAECSRIIAEGKALFSVHGGLHSSLNANEASFSMMMRSSLSQVHSAISGVADMIPFMFEPGNPSSLQFLHKLLDGAHAVRGDSFGLSIPPALYESARNILWWLDNHGPRVEGKLVWATGGLPADHKSQGMHYSGYAWPPSPEQDPILSTHLKLLGWEVHLEGNGQRVVLKIPSDQILKPEPIPSFTSAIVDALPQLLRDAIRRHRFENISNEGELTRAILHDPVAAGEGVLGQLVNNMIWGALLELPQSDRRADMITNGAGTLYAHLSALESLPPEIRPDGIEVTLDPIADFLLALDRDPSTHRTLRTVLRFIDHEYHSDFIQKLD